MNKCIRCFIVFLLSMQLLSCSNEKAQQREILARVNDYNLTLGEFQAKLAGELELNPDFKLTKETKREFLDGLIKKVLLVQEAKKLGLDRRNKFIRTIERYWESTLIRDLLEVKVEEIAQRVLITEADIQASARKIEETRKGGEDTEKTVKMAAAGLKDEKRREILRKWINGLNKTARIEINQDLLQK